MKHEIIWSIKEFDNRMKKLFDEVDKNVRREIYEAAADKASELLPLHFPERELIVQRNKNHFKRAQK